ncbi:MAG: GNAT family N-acetyltransferase [Tepidiformaceae bacterium]
MRRGKWPVLLSFPGGRVRYPRGGHRERQALREHSRHAPALVWLSGSERWLRTPGRTYARFRRVLGRAAARLLRLRPPHSQKFEIHVMGVAPDEHRHGVGRALVEAAVTAAVASGARVLTVKTLSASQPDEGYERTRAFYRGVGFFEIEEFPTLWEPGNPALMMPRILD